MQEFVLAEYLKKASKEEDLTMRFALHCAPVMAGIKASNIITLEGDSSIENVLNGCRLQHKVLCQCHKKKMVFVYRDDLLGNLINNSEIKVFMRKNGYRRFDENYVLERLAYRMREHKFDQTKKIGFPHEIGMLLNYPPSDVKAFIEQDGKNEVCCGYWKVYTDEISAKKTFQLYDQVKEDAVNYVRTGMNLKDLEQKLYQKYALNKFVA